MQNFVDIPDEHKIEAKPNKSFPVPLNEYELSLLQQVSQNLDKSQRYTSRMILVVAACFRNESGSLSSVRTGSN